jgi:hypothetical protein
MPNAVIVGILRAVEAGAILLSGNVRIIVPSNLSVAEFPIGCSLTVIVHQQSDEHLAAESIRRNKDGFLGAT